MTPDAEWIQRWIETEDEKAACRIFQKYYKGVYNYAYKLLRNHEDAQEVAMDTFQKAFRKLDSLEDPAKLDGWLHTIAERGVLSRQRKQARQFRNVVVVSLDDSVGGSEAAVSIADVAAVAVNRHTQHAHAHQDRIALLKRLILLLPKKDRHAMARYYFEELTYKEIAALNLTSEKAVEGRLARTRKLLKTLVTQLNALLNRLSGEEALMMRRYLFDGASPAEIAESLGSSPKQVAEGLERVMARWKKLIATQKRPEKGTTQGSQGGGVNVNLWLIFVKRVTQFLLHWGVSGTRHAHK